MTKKDYKIIARGLKKGFENVLLSRKSKGIITRIISYELQKENPNFDLNKFEIAVFQSGDN